MSRFFARQGYGNFTSLPAAFWRGGTSKAVIFLAKDLPSSTEQRNSIFRKVMGSPDPLRRQLDGMGGGLSSLSKICIVEESPRQDADVNFTFVQVAVNTNTVDYASNCGNMLSAIGPFAIENGFRCQFSKKTATVRIFNTNTGKIIHSSFPMLDDKVVQYDGELAIDGVTGTAAPIALDFIRPGGSRAKSYLPTGNVVDTLNDIEGIGSIQATLADCGNPCVFLRAKDLGISGTILPDELTSHPDLLSTLESIRRRGAVMMGLAVSIEAAAKVLTIPKVCFVSPMARHSLLSRETLERSDADLVTRTISSGDAHRAIPITVAICTAAAAKTPGTLVQEALSPNLSSQSGIVIAHPSGKISVDAAIEKGSTGGYDVATGRVLRTARPLFTGNVFYRE